jgi:hypothetical protein
MRRGSCGDLTPSRCGCKNRAMRRSRRNPPVVRRRCRPLCGLLCAAQRRITGAVTLLAFAATSLGVCVVPVGEVDAAGPATAAPRARCCSGQRAAAATIHVSGRAARCRCSQDSRQAGTCCCAGTKWPAPRKAHSSPKDKGRQGPVWSACNCGGPDSLWLVDSQPKFAARPVPCAACATSDQVATAALRSVPDCSLEPATPPPRPSCA